MIDNISSFKPISLTEFTTKNSSAIYKAENTDNASEFSLNFDIQNKDSASPALNINDTFIRTNSSSEEVGSFFDLYA